MPHSLRSRIKKFHHQGLLSDKDRDRILNALDYEWIPTAERLPNNETYVLVTIQIPGRQPHVRSSWYYNGLFMNDNGDVWNKSDLEVKAWKYSPEPYREDGAE